MSNDGWLSLSASVLALCLEEALVYYLLYIPIVNQCVGLFCLLHAFVVVDDLLIFQAPASRPELSSTELETESVCVYKTFILLSKTYPYWDIFFMYYWLLSITSPINHGGLKPNREERYLETSSSRTLVYGSTSSAKCPTF